MSTSSTTLHPTASTFQTEILESDQPVLVDFWAPWCPPCRMLKPELEKLATELDGKAKVAMVNVDEQPELAEAFRVSSIPALFIMKEGRPVDGWTGYTPKAAMLERVQKHIG